MNETCIECFENLDDALIRVEIMENTGWSIDCLEYIKDEKCEVTFKKRMEKN